MTIPLIFERVSDLCGASHDQARDIVSAALAALGLTVAEARRRPWGSDFIVAPRDLDAFRLAFFNHASLPPELLIRPIDPKVMLIAPGVAMYFHSPERCDTHLRVVHGKIGVTVRMNDEGATGAASYREGLVLLPHRGTHELVNLVGWGVVAELSHDVAAIKTVDRTHLDRLADDGGRS